MVAAFFAAGFFAAAFFAAGVCFFFAAGFVAFFAAGFLTAAFDFFAVVFVLTGAFFFAAGFFAAGFLTVFLAAGFFAAVFFVLALDFGFDAAAVFFGLAAAFRVDLTVALVRRALDLVVAAFAFFVFLFSAVFVAIVHSLLELLSGHRRGGGRAEASILDRLVPGDLMQPAASTALASQATGMVPVVRTLGGQMEKEICRLFSGLVFILNALAEIAA